MVEFKIEGMKCQGCVASITQALKSAGFQDAEITLDPPRVKFPTRAASSPELQALLKNAGNYHIAKADTGRGGATLTPLFVIVSYILGGVFLRAFISNDYSVASLMSNFMGGFFVVFSLFKLLNLSGFADAYATYDILAARSRVYGLAYPFIELFLGIAYFLNYAPLLTNTVTVCLMTLGSIGVFQALKAKRTLQCACLGTALNLPMTTVTLIEDVVMGLMALAMIIHYT